MDKVIDVFLQWGAPGAIIVVLGYAVRSLYVSVRDVQDKRIDEAKSQTEKVITALNANTNAQQSAVSAFQALSDIIKAMQK